MRKACNIKEKIKKIKKGKKNLIENNIKTKLKLLSSNKFKKLLH